MTNRCCKKLLQALLAVLLLTAAVNGSAAAASMSGTSSPGMSPPLAERESPSTAPARGLPSTEPEEVARLVQEQPPPEPPPQLIPASGTRTGIKALIRGIGADFWRFPSQRTAVILGIGGGLALLAHPIDDDLNAHLVGRGRVHDFFLPGKVTGYWYVQIGTSLVTYGVGRAGKKQKVSHLGMDLLRAQIVTQGLTLGVKEIVRRERPDHSPGFSFPSGHSSTTFATATVLERHLGWKAAVPTYLIASYVATSRLHENRHFLSDVLFGGAIGIAVGQTVVRHGRNNFTLSPLVGPGGVGIALIKVWGDPRPPADD